MVVLINLADDGRVKDHVIFLGAFYGREGGEYLIIIAGK